MSKIKEIDLDEVIKGSEKPFYQFLAYHDDEGMLCVGTNTTGFNFRELIGLLEMEKQKILLEGLKSYQ
jgi:hypothetical protein